MAETIEDVIHAHCKDPVKAEEVIRFLLSNDGVGILGAAIKAVVNMASFRPGSTLVGVVTIMAAVSQDQDNDEIAAIIAPMARKDVVEWRLLVGVLPHFIRYASEATPSSEWAGVARYVQSAVRVIKKGE